jgi:transcriptional regulator with XRE-family HTH domain
MRYSRLRDQLRQARRGQSLSQAALAARSGTSRVTVARLEAGSARDVRVGTVVRVAEALGLEVAAVPLGGEPILERRLAREQERARQLDRRLAHARLAVHLLTVRRNEANVLISTARAAVDRWEQDRLCSHHYISRWRAMLAGTVHDVARSLLDPGEWADALFQNTPWALALERQAA